MTRRFLSIWSPGLPLERLSDWCERYTPLAAPDPPDGVMLDVTGVAHLWGGEGGLLDDLFARLGGAVKAGAAAKGLRAAIADTPAAAWALARFHPAGRIIVPPGALRAALDPLPVAALRLSAAVAEGLDAVGLRRIGDLHRQPRAGLAARFGQELCRRLDQALGRLDEPISPRRPPPPHLARRAFAEPISRPEDLAAALDRLLGEVCAGMARAGAGARRLTLSAWRIDQKPGVPPQMLEIGTARPLGDPAALARLFAPKLERLAPGPGFEVMALAAPAVGSLQPTQEGFAGRENSAGLADLADALDNRLGAGATLRLVPRQSWLPERAVAAASPLASPGDDLWPAELWPADRPRPVRLLAPPEPVEATAPLPDDPPILFRWRGAVYRVRRAEGPERLLAEWWRRDAPPRDYYRVEDGDGRRFWLFRQGLHQNGGGLADGSPPRWFLHGVFG